MIIWFECLLWEKCSNDCSWPRMPIGRCHRIAVIGPRRLCFSGCFGARCRTRTLGQKRKFGMSGPTVSCSAIAVVRHATNERQLSSCQQTSRLSWRRKSGFRFGESELSTRCGPSTLAIAGQLRSDCGQSGFATQFPQPATKRSSSPMNFRVRLAYALKRRSLSDLQRQILELPSLIFAVGEVAK